MIKRDEIIRSFPVHLSVVVVVNNVFFTPASTARPATGWLTETIARQRCSRREEASVFLDRIARNVRRASKCLRGETLILFSVTQSSLGRVSRRRRELFPISIACVFDSGPDDRVALPPGRKKITVVRPEDRPETKGARAESFSTGRFRRRHQRSRRRDSARGETTGPRRTTNSPDTPPPVLRLTTRSYDSARPYTL